MQNPARRQAMKIIAPALFLIFAFFSVYCPVTASPQEDSDASEIKEVIKDYLDAMAYGDLSFAKRHISPRFSATIGGTAIDYENFDSFRDTQIERVHKRYMGYSITDLNIFLEIGDNQATAEASFYWKALNSNTLEEITRKRVMKFTLDKENGAWNIVSIAILPALEADNSLLFKRDPDFSEIKKTVDRYLQAFARKDKEAAMSVISPYYKDTFEGKAIDYDLKKRHLEFTFNVILEGFDKCSISDVRYVGFEHRGDTSRVKINYIWEGTDTETGKREGYSRSRDFELAKENGAWMIARVSMENRAPPGDMLYDRK